VAWTDGSATRPGRAAAFGPAVTTRPQPEYRRLEVDGPEPTTPGPDLASLCSPGLCRGAKLFTWPGGEQLVALPDGNGRWYLASRQADGRFDRPRLATRMAGAPLWTETPGVVAFVKALPSGAVYSAPYRAATRAPRVTLGRPGRRFELPVTCDTTCSVGVAVRGGGRAASDAMEPMETAVLAPEAPRASRVRATITARGAGGTRHVEVELRRVRGAWRATTR
jgi:hypothetical protein